jgi:hypothetical protein
VNISAPAVEPSLLLIYEILVSGVVRRSLCFRFQIIGRCISIYSSSILDNEQLRDYEQDNKIVCTMFCTTDEDAFFMRLYQCGVQFAYREKDVQSFTEDETQAAHHHVLPLF